jgi:hypothetical protein
LRSSSPSSFIRHFADKQEASISLSSILVVYSSTHLGLLKLQVYREELESKGAKFFDSLL